MTKRVAVRNSIIFTIIECILFLAVCALQAKVVPSSANANFYRDLVSGIFQGYLALIGGVATTWYVVFTYYLMRSTIEYNQQWSLPYINADWVVSNETPKLKANRYFRFPTIEEDEAPQAAEVGGARWVVLVLTNVRLKPIDKVKFKISINSESDVMLAPKPFEIQCDKRGLKMEKDIPVQIGIADILLLPKNIVLRFSLKEISYMAIDSSEEQTVVNGEKTFAISGLAMIVPAKEA